MSVITKALYKRQWPDRPGCSTFTRKELKALAQHDADPNRKDGVCSYRRNRSRVLVDVHVDQCRGSASYLWSDGTIITHNS